MKLNISEANNPTIFIVTDTNDPRFDINFFVTREQYIHHVESLRQNGKLFGSYYRPGSFWEEEVFVCPKCQHATLITNECSIVDDGFCCKYCYTDWIIQDGRLFIYLENKDTTCAA